MVVAKQAVRVLLTRLIAHVSVLRTGVLIMWQEDNQLNVGLPIA